MINRCKKQLGYLIAATLTVVVFCIPLISSAVFTSHDYPRIAAWQLNANKTSASELAKYDVVILQMNAQTTNPNIFDEIRRRNPDVIILAYTSPIEYPKPQQLSYFEPSGFGLWHELGKNLKPEWYLKTYQGEELNFWPGNYGMNPIARAANGQTYGNYLGNFLHDRVLATGKWDGLLFDTTHNTVHWLNEDLDIDSDRQKDSIDEINQGWRNGQREIFNAIRGKSGDKYLIITNGDGTFEDVNNGRMFESFPEFYEGGWNGSMDRYFATDRGGKQPRVNIINADTDNTGNFQNYQMMRYGLTSALLSNGYYNFDYGTLNRSEVQYYDEYAISLGKPTSAAFNVLSIGEYNAQPGVWRRDFQSGISLLNSTNRTRTIQLPDAFEKIQGSQDPNANSGAAITKVTIAPNDGIILLNPLQEVVGSSYVNGAYTKAFTPNGETRRKSFFSFDERFPGNRRVLKIDSDDNGTLETFVADDSSISIYADNGRLLSRFFPYSRAYASGINFTVADLENDGTKEIITGTERGGGPHIRVFNNRGRLINPGFFAYGRSFRGGVQIGVGDLDGDGLKEIIAGAGVGGGPHVRVFSKHGNLINPGFFAYNPSFRGGVNVSVGDINGDGIDEIITGPGNGETPLVRIWNKDGVKIKQFFAFSTLSKKGVEVAAIDIDGDRIDEVIGMTRDFSLFR